MSDYQYIPRQPLLPFHERAQRWAILICHRRTGKTVAVLNDMIIRAMLPRPDGLRQQFAYICPYQGQARSVAWQYLLDFTAPLSKCQGYAKNEASLSVTLPDPLDTNKKGSTIMLRGAENAESLRGLFLDGACLDEYQDIPKYVFDTIIRPALADRGGWAIFSGTVRGVDNPLWDTYQTALKDPQRWFAMLLKASESGIIPPEELADLKASMTQEAYNAEMECDPNATVTGRILLPYLNQQQVTRVPYQLDGGPVITAWDLGMSDTTSIWTAQVVGREVHLLEFYENSGHGLEHYVDWLRKRAYARAFGVHLMPHDTNVRELGTGVSRIETLRKMGMRNIKIVPKLPKAQQIDAGRMLLGRCWIDQDGCEQGLKAIRGYQFSFDQKRQVFSQSPLHDKHSNGADSFLQLAVGLKKAMASEGGASGAFGETGDFDLSDDDRTAYQEPWEMDSELY